ncbi:hypothetical protein QBC35DRAFT_384874 [Podospora australis]|uniref:Uncharacterized protein n=1 Tax=Podospora australis TaxID=1536484 RepID=A0AAN6WSL9_9PEZI|nr:hypothetical protein QBC35DRAFT_384874 [Podospora australis]
METGDAVHGWVPQPDTRGTMDIVWTCVVTTILCTYAILCLNCPPRDEGLIGELRRKLLWVGIGIVGPEFVLTIAFDQFVRARDSVAMFRQEKSGLKTWTYRHAFFANMGGFELSCPDCPPFRINSQHIQWLVNHRYINPPEISEEELWDKSKHDTLARVITCLQCGYMILTCIGRTVQGLAITTLELSTLAMVVCSLMTSICWLRKPLDVRYPVRITMTTPIAEVLHRAGSIATQPYRQNPLDFIDDYRPSWALNVHTCMSFASGNGIRPLTRVGDSRMPKLTWKESPYLCIATLMYASIHLIGWRYTFPTRVEQTLWRISSCILVATTVSYWLVQGIAKASNTRYFEKGIMKQSGQRVDTDLELGKKDDEAGSETLRPARMQLKSKAFFWRVLPLAIAYALARGYIIFEALLGLRSLPASAYLNIEWLSLIPHL